MKEEPGTAERSSGRQPAAGFERVRIILCMHVRLAVVIAGTALSSAVAQEQRPSPGPEAGQQPPGGAGAPQPDVGFGGSGDAASEAAEKAEQLRTQVQQLQQTIEQQGVALEETREQLQQLEMRLQQEEQLSTTVEQRTIQTEQKQRADRSQQRAAGIERALEYIVAAQEVVAAGSQDVGAYLGPAQAQLESAANEAGQWGSAAEAGFLLEAAQHLRQIPGMIATRNFQDATVLLFAAQQRVETALTFARTPVAPQ